MTLANQIATQGGIAQVHHYPDTRFPLASWQSDLSESQGGDVHVYIEGDGLAWLTPSRISANPTPIDPLALKLAAQDPYRFKVYLGRPGQYGDGPHCDNRYWTSHRFNREIVARYQVVLNDIKSRYDVKSFTLIGYSGGGAIAALLAAQRDDVAMLMTVAGNLDTRFWTQWHHLSPLDGSLNPADFAAALSHVPQFHLVGEKDRIVGLPVFESFRQKLVAPRSFEWQLYEGFDHHCCWDSVWQAELLKRISSQAEGRPLMGND